MKTLKFSVIALALSVPFLANAQNWDDIYGSSSNNSQKATSERKTSANDVKKAKKKVVVINDDGDMVIKTTGNVNANFDVDAYNRRSIDSQSDEDVYANDQAIDSTEYQDYEYTDRIVKYHNPKNSVTVASDNDINVYVLDDNYAGYYADRDWSFSIGWGGYYPWYSNRYYYGYTGWYGSWYNPWYYSGWYGYGWGWPYSGGYYGWYDPWYSPGWYVGGGSHYYRERYDTGGRRNSGYAYGGRGSAPIGRSVATNGGRSADYGRSSSRSYGGRNSTNYGESNTRSSATRPDGTYVYGRTSRSSASEAVSSGARTRIGNTDNSVTTRSSGSSTSERSYNYGRGSGSIDSRSSTVNSGRSSSGSYSAPTRSSSRSTYSAPAPTRSSGSYSAPSPSRSSGSYGGGGASSSGGGSRSSSGGGGRR